MSDEILCCRLLFADPSRHLAQENTNLPATAPTQLTIYNGDFAVARTSVPLDLHAGTTESLTTDVTSQLEPDSVLLRDPAGQHPLSHRGAELRRGRSESGMDAQEI